MERIMQLQEQDATAALAASDSTTLPADQRLMRWLAYARQRQADRLDTGKARLLEQAGQCGLTPEALRQGLRQHLGTGLAHDLCQDYADWCDAKVRAIESEQLAVIDAAMGEVLDHLVPSDAGVKTPDTASGTQLYRWLIPTFGGGLLGLLLLGPDGIGGTLGALFGSAGGIAGVVWLANHPDVLGYPGRASGSDRLSTTSPATWLRLSWLQNPIHWLLSKAQHLARRLAIGLVDLVLPQSPITTASLPTSSIAPIYEHAFDLLTTLVFLRCTAGANCDAPPRHDDPNLPITEGSVLRALRALVRALDRQPADTETIRDLAEELHQRMEDSGYACEVLPDGTPFQEEHRQRFHPFGLVATGDPVETLEPCFRRGEAILLPGPGQSHQETLI